MDFSHVEWNYSYVTNHAEGAKLGHSGCRLASAGWHAATPRREGERAEPGGR